MKRNRLVQGSHIEDSGQQFCWAKERSLVNYTKRPRDWISILKATLFLGLVLVVFKGLMLYAQHRSGTLLYDPILNHLGPWNMSVTIFVLTYVSLGIGANVVWKERYQVVPLIYSYALLQIFRIITILLLPLEPPSGMIVLSDPISDHLVFGELITKDLFFSGHVSALVLFSLFMRKKVLRWAFRTLAFIDAILLMGQHVHYTVDLLFAPCFAYFAYAIIERIVLWKESE